MLEEGKGLLACDIRSKTATIIGSGEEKFTATITRKVGEAVAAVLLHPAETQNRYIHVHSFTLTQNKLLEALERISGSKFDLSRMSRAEMHARGTRHLAEGDWDAGYLELVTAAVYSGSKHIMFEDRADYGNRVLGLAEDVDLLDVIEGVLKKVGVA